MFELAPKQKFAERKDAPIRTEPCGKCGYKRRPEDLAPDYECPRCGIVYAKFDASSQSTQPADPHKINCSWCGAETPRGRKHCVRCGTSSGGDWR